MIFFAEVRTHLLALGALCVLFFLLPAGAAAEEENDLERRGLFGRLFHRDGQQKLAAPGYNDTVQDVYTDRETDTISSLVDDLPKTVERRENDPVERYPKIPGYLSIKNSSQKDIDQLIEKIYDAYELRIDRMDPPDLRRARVLAMGIVPTGFPTVWRNRVNSAVWSDQRSVRRGMEDIYRRTLQHSNQVKVFSDLPLIRETGMQEADGEFDIETFIEGRAIRRNEPIGSTLTTGNAATRFLENEDYVEGGFRKKFATGAEATISNRFSTLKNNSTFLVPQNQGSSEMVVSVVQPILEGGGYHYNQSKIKLARFDARMASAEFVRQLQSHLIEVNRAYWALYYSRAYFILTRNLVSDTQAILGQLEQRSDLDALQSEVLRARSSLAMRKAMLSRAEMAIRNSEERLRALVNDPDQDIGSDAEMIPATMPIVARYLDDVGSVASDALRNRPEIQQGFDELRAAIVRRDMQKNQKMPTLNLVAEMMLADIEPSERVGRAWDNQFGDGTGYVLGFQYSQPWDNDTDRAQLLRTEFELRQQANRLRSTIDLVLLEAVVSYRELMTAYRDMQGRYSALRATREEVRQLRDRLEVDTQEEGGRTTASQLQLILDSMDRNQTAEEMFLDSVVAYNAAFASLDRARGTFLKSEDVEIKRVRDTDPTHPTEELERLQISKPANVTGKGGKSYDGKSYSGRGSSSSSYDGYASSTATPESSSDNLIPNVPQLTLQELAQSGAVANSQAPKKKGFFSGQRKPKSEQPAIASKSEQEFRLFAGGNGSKKRAADPRAADPSATVTPISSISDLSSEPPRPSSKFLPAAYPDTNFAVESPSPVQVASFAPPARVEPKPASSASSAPPAPSVKVVPAVTVRKARSSEHTAPTVPSASARQITR